MTNSITTDVLIRMAVNNDGVSYSLASDIIENVKAEDGIFKGRRFDSNTNGWVLV